MVEVWKDFWVLLALPLLQLQQGHFKQAAQDHIEAASDNVQEDSS